MLQWFMNANEMVNVKVGIGDKNQDSVGWIGNDDGQSLSGILISHVAILKAFGCTLGDNGADAGHVAELQNHQVWTTIIKHSIT